MGLTPEILVVRAGPVPYGDALDCQGAIAAARLRGTVPDVLLLLEHPPVYTRGRRTQPEELPMGEDWYRSQGIEVCDSDRGGAVTYHGPGQLVGYPIVSLRPYRNDVRDYVGRMERTMIAALDDWGVPARVVDGLTGVWVMAAGEGDPAAAVATGVARKIGSIGVHISRGITTHGFAVNVNNDLQPFEWVVPCGIENCRMTSLCSEAGEQRDLQDFASTVVGRYAGLYGRDPVETPAGELAERVPGAAALARSSALRLGA